MVYTDKELRQRAHGFMTLRPDFATERLTAVVRKEDADALIEFANASDMKSQSDLLRMAIARLVDDLRSGALKV